MRALVCIRPGELEYQEKDAPLARPGQAILKIRRVGICGTDLHAFEGTQPFFDYPRVPGHELAGDLIDLDLESAASEKGRYRAGSMDAGLQPERPHGFIPGEAVTIIPYFNCGHCIACRTGKPNCCTTMNVCGVHSDGGMVDYLSVPSSSLVHGNGLNYDELALVEPLAIGAHAVRRAAVEKEEFVLVVGMGPIGLGVLESARIAGAQVIAMDVNTDRLNFCRKALQVLHTIDAAGTAVSDIAGQLAEITRGDMPTVVFDATGSRSAINNAFYYMAHGGRYVLVGLQKGEVCFSHPEFHKREGTLMSSRNATREDFDRVMDSIKKGLIDPTAYITHRVAFGQVKNEFAGWLDPAAGVIKAMVEM
ncbi:MAG TPA: zinc-binding alcohol dehydrogenase family protein [Puia sp.]|nr:zinc-binding alcohol dehydrogenase family protein [Puia sp.]